MSAAIRKQNIFSEMYLYSNPAGHFHSIIGGRGRNKGGKVFDPGVHTCSSKFYCASYVKRSITPSSVPRMFLSFFSLGCVNRITLFYFKREAKVSVLRARRQQEFSVGKR